MFFLPPKLWSTQCLYTLWFKIPHLSPLLPGSPVRWSSRQRLSQIHQRTLLLRLKKKESHENLTKRVRTETLERDRFHRLLKSSLLLAKSLSLHRFTQNHRFLLKPPPVQRVYSRLRQNLLRCILHLLHIQIRRTFFNPVLQVIKPSYQPLRISSRRIGRRLSHLPPKAVDTLSPTLVDPALVSVVGVVDGQTTSGLSGPAEKKSKKVESKKSSTSTKPARSDKSVKSSTINQGKPTTSSTDSKISDLNKKWSDRFNRLEALLLAKTIDKPQEPVFSPAKVAPARAPPANVVRPDPFLKPASQPAHLTDPAVDSPATDSSQHKPAARASSSAQSETATRETVQKRLTRAFDTTRQESPSPSDSDSDSLSSDRPPIDIFPEEGELSDDQEANLSDHEQSLSEEQSYCETMRGIRSYMSWDHIPDIDSGTTTSEDNPFAGPKLHTPGKVSVNLPTDEWLCRKMSKLNITLVQGYPTRTSEAGGLLRDNLSGPRNHNRSGMGFMPTPRRTLISWSLHGTPDHQN